MTERPLFFVGCFYLAGVVVAFLYEIPIISCAILLILSFIFYKFNSKKVFMICIAFALAVVSVDTWVYKNTKICNIAKETRQIECFVLDFEIRNGYVIYNVKTDFAGESANLDIVSYETEVVAVGNDMLCDVKLEKKPQKWWSTGTSLEGIAENIVDLGKNNTLFAGCLRTRTALKLRMDEIFSGNAREVLEGILLGEKAALSAKTEEIFQKSGASHLLTVSGFHFTMLAFLVYSTFSRVGLSEKTCSLLTIPAIIYLAGVEGMTVSVTRALLMSIYVYLADLLQRDKDMLNSWGFTVLFVLIFEPILIFNVSFLLSYAATLGIFLFYDVVKTQIYKIVAVPSRYSEANLFAKRCVSSVAVSISANVLTLPFLLIFFGKFSLASVISSAFVCFLMPLIFVFSVLSIVCPINILTNLLSNITQVFARLLYKILEYIAKYDLNIYGQENVVIVAVLLLYLIFLLLYLKKANCKQSLKIIAIYLILAVFMCSFTISSRPNYVKMTVAENSVILTNNSSAAIVGCINSESNMREIDKILQINKIKNIDVIYLMTDDEMSAMHSVEFIRKWNPKNVFADAEIEEFSLIKDIKYDILENQKIVFWDKWSILGKDNTAIIDNKSQQFLKINEKYSLIPYKTDDFTIIFGNEYMIYGDATIQWNKTWDSQLQAIFVEETV